MRNRITMAQTITAARRAGLGLGVFAICLAAAIAPGRAQTAADQNSTDELYGLRGTTTPEQSAQSSAASTLYGALPANRTTSAKMSADDRTDTTRTAAFGQPADVTASATATETEDLTGSIGAVSELNQADRDYAASLARQNDRVGTLDDLPLNAREDKTVAPGFMFGALTLRPTLSERIMHESVRYGDTRTSRTYSATTLSGTLQSDWSRHSLSVDGTATWQKNLSGTGTESPSADVNARLDLDLVDDLTGTLGAGYSYSRESRTDPNAIANATSQAGVHELRASAGLRKDLGLLRGTTSLQLTRKLYGDATLDNGGIVSGDDRDTLGAELTARIGYAVSPALVPFLEASVGREKYDQRIDTTGAQRSSKTYAARAGAEINLGDKLSGELAAGYVLRSLDDPTLSDISGLTLDGNLKWSPRRGTDVDIGLTTTLESATAAGESGAIVYEFESNLTQQIHSAVVARLGATTTVRDYDSGAGRSNQLGYGASAGLTWSINRYLDLEAVASYERVKEPGQTDEEKITVGLGLKLRR